MKPLVKDPKVTLEQLLHELNDPQSEQTASGEEGQTHADEVLAAVVQKTMRVLRQAGNQRENNPQIKAKLDELERHWGVEPEQLHSHLYQMGVTRARAFCQQHSDLHRQLQQVTQLLGSQRRPLISEHEDRLMVREQSYGDYQKPEDYLDRFGDFIREQLNESVALSVVVTRPKDLTREQLKEVRLLLDRNGFSETNISTAWRNRSNQEIAASIVGYIRQAALGEALIPFEQRVERAMHQIYQQDNWSKVQRKWLQRLAKQLSHEVVMDQSAVNRAFIGDGGAKRLDKMLSGRLGEVLERLSTTLWSEVG